MVKPKSISEKPSVSSEPQARVHAAPGGPDGPPLTNAELVQLRVRMVALENLVISLLAHASDEQLDRAREMASYITPRVGFTPHRLTIHAAAEMVSLVERANRFRAGPPM